MITLSENARKELEAYFADKERQTIRVYLAPGGCSGPRLVLALDEPGDEDARFEQDGFAFCINKELLQQVKSVSIDLSYLGFTVTPEVPLPSSGGSSCGGCCGSCGSQPLSGGAGCPGPAGFVITEGPVFCFHQLPLPAERACCPRASVPVPDGQDAPQIRPREE